MHRGMNSLRTGLTVTENEGVDAVTDPALRADC